MSRTIRVEQIVTEAVFHGIFGSHGTLVQPTPENKPKSKVVIRRVGGSVLYQMLGGDEAKFRGTEWIKGGAPSRSFGFFGFGRGGGGFSKGKKLKQAPVFVSSNDVEIKYSGPSSKLTFSVEFSNSIARGSDMYSDY